MRGMWRLGRCGVTIAALLVGAGPLVAGEVTVKPAAQAPKPAVASVKVEGAEKAKPVKTAKAKKAEIVTSSLGPLPPPIAFSPEGGLVHWYAERGPGVVFPNTETLPYCHGYDCLYQTRIRMTDEDLAALKAIFATRSHSAEAEREGINLAVSWFENRAAPLLGGPPDVRGSDLAHSGQPGQTDCLDEATNSTTLLIYLQEEGLLRYHRVIRPTSRGGLLLTLAHATAVFTDPDGKDWVVDSWMRDSGDPNDVMALDEWESHLF